MSLTLSQEKAVVKPAKEKKKPKMTYSEALTILEQNDTVIKEAAQHRKRNDINPSDSACGASALKLFCAGTGTLILAIPLQNSGMVGDGMLSLIVATGAAAVPGAILPLLYKNLGRLISPLRYRKILKKQATEQQLVDLKEAEFEKILAQVIKKTEKARKVLNAELGEEGRSVEFNKMHGQEGFYFTADTRSVWEKERTQISRKKALKAIAGSETVLNGPLALGVTHRKELSPST